MTDIVAKEAGGVESVKAVCEKYNNCIVHLQQMMEMYKDGKASAMDAGKLGYDIIADLDDETRLSPTKVEDLRSRVLNMVACGSFRPVISQDEKRPPVPEMSKMTDIVAEDAGGVKSVKAVCAKYNERIERIRQMMKIRKKKKASTEDIGKLACGIIADLEDDTRLPPDEVKALKARVLKEATGAVFNIEGTNDIDRYGNDCIVTMYVASRMSMRKIAAELGINVSTVSRHVRKWAEENAELRGALSTTREVELSRLDDMLEQVEKMEFMDLEKRYSTMLHILDRKYRLMGLYASGPQVVVGIGVQQGQQSSQPRVIEDVARDISDDTA